MGAGDLEGLPCEGATTPPVANLLESMAVRGDASLHARGWTASTALIDGLKDLEGPILDLGCGTGETAVRLALEGRRLVGVDRSTRMLATARKRAKWCGVRSNLGWVRIGDGGQLPFPDGTFSAIVIESVLAIQSPSVLRQMVREIARVARPQGLVHVNETVWLSGTGMELAANVNHATLQATGIIQACTDPFDRAAWVDMFEQAGFQSLSIQSVEDLQPSTAEQALEIIGRLPSWTFTVSRRLAARLMGERGSSWDLKQAGLAPGVRILEGVLFRMRRAG